MKDERRLRFVDETNTGPVERHWSFVNPDHEPLHEALHKARYNLEGLNQCDAYLLCEAVESYIHLVAHPAPTKSIIDQLRKIRARVKANNKETPND